MYESKWRTASRGVVAARNAVAGLIDVIAVVAREWEAAFRNSGE